MTTLVTGSAGHLGEALMRSLRLAGRAVIGMDLLPSPFTDFVGSIRDRAFVQRSMRGMRVIIHYATLHKPHVATHANRDFVETNISGTLVLLEEASAAEVEAFVFTSTTSAFGSALTPAPGEPAAWVTADVVPIPRNIYGVTKVAAENLCEMFHRQRHVLDCLRAEKDFRSPLARQVGSKGYRATAFERGPYPVA
jgi:nucleoside-diphosphate-sugar epimerase